MKIHVAFDLELNHGARDHRPAPHDHGGDRAHENYVPSELCHGIHRNTGGMNTKLLQKRSP